MEGKEHRQKLTELVYRSVKISKRPQPLWRRILVHLWMIFVSVMALVWVWKASELLDLGDAGNAMAFLVCSAFAFGIVLAHITADNIVKEVRDIARGTLTTLLVIQMLGQEDLPEEDPPEEDID